MTISIPLALKSAIESGDCVLFLGAGIGAHLQGLDGKPLPDAAALSGEMAAHFSISFSGDPPSLSKMSQLVEIRKTREQLDEFLRKRLANSEPDDVLGWITTRRWQAIYTTNYDSGIPRAYEKSARPAQTPRVISKTSELNLLQDFEVPIYFIHGALFGASATGRVVITEKDYTRFREERRMLFERLKNHFATSPFLYIGYSNRDPNWSLVLDEVEEEFSPSRTPRSFRVCPHEDAFDEEILLSRNIETIHTDLAGFVATTQAVLNELAVDSDKLGRLRKLVPHDLREAFDKNPAAATRLLNSWDYVNQTDFSAASNLQDFLLGDRAKWSLLAERKFFKRDIEDDVFDEALDYITGENAKPGVIPILGPAGYGTTTLLMALATRLVDERAGRVFFHRPGAALLEGDIDFAVSLFGGSTIFFIDDAPQNAAVIVNVLNGLRATKARALFVLGSRLNEWSQARFRISSKSFEIDPLSDAEIERLLKFLESNNALQGLANLKEDLRFAFIRTRANKELLVALREAADGRGLGFDAIIEDEFRKIGSDVAKEAYLTVCCCYQFGAYVRDATLANMLNRSLTDFYEAIADATNGVIVFDVVDQVGGITAARARHSTIARIVWERSGSPAGKDAVLQRSLELLNLTYRVDVEAFEHFTRTDRLIDSIRSFDDKARFFETACRKDPENPYVRQHYARMLLRAEKPELALGQIEEGILLNPKSVPKVLLHTKGIILTELATSIESTDIARKRMVQAEGVFRSSIQKNIRDDYAHTALAQLYLKWAQRDSISEDESSDYLTKAEGAVSEGLRACSDKEALWVVSASIEHKLGDQPARMKALEKAVKENPIGVVPRFLLGRLYRKKGKHQEAIAILKPVVEGHPEEFRAVQEYALAMLDGGAKLPEAIAVLRLGETYGLSDLRFICLLGGLLFLDKQFDRAEEAFGASERRDFAYKDLITINFRPKSGPECSNQLTGRVVRMGTSYCFVEVQGYPLFYCPFVRVGKLSLRVGADIRFLFGFAAKGPRVDEILWASN
ncbi:SIR2 family protein [Dokdonella sp.]|uniref:P-loop NTPase n=1 Tax=Dokdonella sp. TaxID=2291710 RepID=UPI0037848AA4